MRYIVKPIWDWKKKEIPSNPPMIYYTIVAWVLIDENRRKRRVKDLDKFMQQHDCEYVVNEIHYKEIACRE